MSVEGIIINLASSIIVIIIKATNALDAKCYKSRPSYM